MNIFILIHNPINCITHISTHCSILCTCLCVKHLAVTKPAAYYSSFMYMCMSQYLHMLPVIVHNFVQHIHSLLSLRQEVKGRQIGDVHIFVHKEITNFRCRETTTERMNLNTSAAQYLQVIYCFPCTENKL